MRNIIITLVALFVSVGCATSPETVDPVEVVPATLCEEMLVVATSCPAPEYDDTLFVRQYDLTCVDQHLVEGDACFGEFEAYVACWAASMADTCDLSATSTTCWDVHNAWQSCVQGGSIGVL